MQARVSDMYMKETDHASDNNDAGCAPLWVAGKCDRELSMCMESNSLFIQYTR